MSRCDPVAADTVLGLIRDAKAAVVSCGAPKPCPHCLVLVGDAAAAFSDLVHGL